MNKLIVLTLLSLSLVSCKYGVTYNSISALKDKKENVVKILDEDLSTENQVILREYFSSIKNLAYTFKVDQRMQAYTHKKFFRYFKENMCENSILSNDEYEQVVKKCNVNGFYICSDEVKYYKQMILETKKYFTKNEIKKISENTACKEKLLSLGVINE